MAGSLVTKLVTLDGHLAQLGRLGSVAMHVANAVMTLQFWAEGFLV